MEGWLSKRGNRVTTWKRRWFEIYLIPETKESRIRYWTDEHRTELKGEVIISSKSEVFSVAAEGTHKFCFRLLTNNTAGAKQDLLMDADAAHLRMKWIMAIESFILDLKEVEDVRSIAAIAGSSLPAAAADSAELQTRHLSMILSTARSPAESRSLELIDLLVQAWMTDNEDMYERCVTENMHVTVHSHAFTLKATGRENAWDVRSNAFFVPLDVYLLNAVTVIDSVSAVGQLLILQRSSSAAASPASILAAHGSAAISEEYEVEFAFDPITGKICKMIFDRVDILQVFNATAMDKPVAIAIVPTKDLVASSTPGSSIGTIGTEAQGNTPDVAVTFDVAQQAVTGDALTSLSKEDATALCEGLSSGRSSDVWRSTMGDLDDLAGMNEVELSLQDDDDDEGERGSFRAEEDADISFTDEVGAVDINVGKVEPEEESSLSEAVDSTPDTTEVPAPAPRPSGVSPLIRHQSGSTRGSVMNFAKNSAKKFKSKEFQQAYMGLMRWTDSLNLSQPSEFAINFPEYFSVSASQMLSGASADPESASSHGSERSPKFKLDSKYTMGDILSIQVRVLRSMVVDPTSYVAGAKSRAENRKSLVVPKEDIIATTMSISMNSTLESVFEMMSDKFSSVGVEVTHPYVFKLHGFKEYLLHKFVPIHLFECAARAFRMQEYLNLTVQFLSDKELEALTPMINQNTHDMMAAGERKYGVHTYAQVLRPSANVEELVDILPKETSTNHVPFGAVTSSKEQIPVSKLDNSILKETINSPLYIHVHGIRFPGLRSRMAANLKLSRFDSFFVEIYLYFNGEEILEKPLVTLSALKSSLAQNPDSSPSVHDGEWELRIPGGPISSDIRLANVPETTRVVFKVFGHFVNKYGQSSNKNLANVSVNLFDNNNILNFSNSTVELNINSTSDELEAPKQPSSHGFGKRGNILPLFKAKKKKKRKAKKELEDETANGSSADAKRNGDDEVDLSGAAAADKAGDSTTVGVEVDIPENLSSDIPGGNYQGLLQATENGTAIPICLVVSFDYPYSGKVIYTETATIKTLEAESLASSLEAIQSAASVSDSFRAQSLHRRKMSLLSRRALAPSRIPSGEEWATLAKIERLDPLSEIPPDWAILLWDCRNACVRRPSLLNKFLRVVWWKSAHAAAEARKMLMMWTPCQPTEALELLDIRYSDPTVREYAVQRLCTLTDERLQELLLQLVQVLKYENYHDSPLARFLLRRALVAPLVIGHPFFWMLRSEMHLPMVRERFGVLLMVYLSRCGKYKESFRQQIFLNDELTHITVAIKSIEKDKRVPAARALLNEMLGKFRAVGNMNSFVVSLTPRIELNGIRVEKCNVLSSKKVPLWVTFYNADPLGVDYPVIFKVGDDLRQDQLTLQVIKLMDTLWRGEFEAPPESVDLASESLRLTLQRSDTVVSTPKPAKKEKVSTLSKMTSFFSKKPKAAAEEDHDEDSADASFSNDARPNVDTLSSKFEPLDLRMKSYRCVSTGDQVGMIEVVVSSSTLANIQTDYGGKISGAFASTPICDYLKEFNVTQRDEDIEDGVVESLYETAVDNFARTCAGYCVATYVLGIGDRHGDNIMVSRSGHLFHIDFGHFLGNFKYFLGLNRERAPFVFTREMAFVLTSSENGPINQYAEFESMCCKAYNVLRKRGQLLITLFALMIPASMPELLLRSDIIYLREMLSLELTEEQASEKFKFEIKNSLNTFSRRFDNWIHNIKHKM